jgi:hypothetical protein
MYLLTLINDGVLIVWVVACSRYRGTGSRPEVFNAVHDGGGNDLQILRFTVVPAIVLSLSAM